MLVKKILWYGCPPLPGIQERLEIRGFSVLENPSLEIIEDRLLNVTLIVVLNHMQDGDNGVQLGYERLQMFIDHGIRVLVLGRQ
jgi:hypothetical protein